MLFSAHEEYDAAGVGGSWSSGEGRCPDVERLVGFWVEVTPPPWICSCTYLFSFPGVPASGVAAREPPLHLVSCKGVLRCLSSVVTACSLLSGVSQVCSGVFVCRFGGPVLGVCSLGLTFGFGSSMAFVSSLALGCFLLARLQSRPSLKNLPVVYVAKNHRWVASGVLSSAVSCVWFDVLFRISPMSKFRFSALSFGWLDLGLSCV
ncbi:unnamed protein product [Brassica napus]|uniref:(rape) hypothetical protein n=1 Tax=Brassica napus TaxID=3708 RepID=A0A816JYT7_BRANA|nr:unnamed protein product [Brassica napus]